MPDTFGGTWNRPRTDGRGHSQRELEDRASYDNQPQTGCASALFLLSILATTAVAAIRKGRTT
ncbi:hypothetical protein ACFW08_20065 [Streptomyces sp. NPDC058960]|uniref:hypothetical protein n=1 Tax=Streptomyces sp. NPDC058960 TaxID=3346679 RepID=UPI0036C25F47